MSKALQKFVSDVEAQNEEFRLMTPAQRRVAIAEDVLKLISVGVLVPTRGRGYVVPWELNGLGPAVYTFDGNLDDLRDDVACRVVTCEVCARGAITVAALLRNAGFEPPFDRASEEGTIPGADGLLTSGAPPQDFGGDMLISIEGLFEGWASPASGPVVAQLCDRTRYYYSLDSEDVVYPRDYTDGVDGLNNTGLSTLCATTLQSVVARRRLKRVMQWIIDHDGEFDVREFVEAEIARLEAERKEG